MKKLTKKEWVAVTLSVFVVGFFFIFGQYFIKFFQTDGVSGLQAVGTKENSLVINDISVGSGDIAEAGNRVTINYVGRLEDGTIFDSSTVHAEPAQFVVGSGQVIEGLDKGIVGMRVGGKRTLRIPSNMGYGANDIDSIPGGSTLMFEIELLKAEKPI